MTRGIKVRLMLFVILSAVGVVYVAGSYLGIVDRILGRGYTIHATLPDSGGLFVGSEVTYRGVKVGKVSAMRVTRDGLTADLALQEGTRLPQDSKLFVHNLSAVGEQYLDVVPVANKGPYATAGSTIHGDSDSLPLGEDVLLEDLNAFVGSVNKDNLSTVVTELGDMFRDNATALRSIVDNAQGFVQTAQANQQATIDLLTKAQPVLQTQVDRGSDIQAFSRDLASLTGTLRGSDADIRTILHDAGPTASEVTALTESLRVVLPPFLQHVIPVGQTVSARLPGLEQLLVTFPRLIAAGPTALSEGKQKYGRVNLNLNMSPPPCTDGYLPVSQRRATSEESFVKYYPAQCKSGAPVNMRGMKYAPAPTDGSGDGNIYRTSPGGSSSGAAGADWMGALTGAGQ